MLKTFNFSSVAPLSSINAPTNVQVSDEGDDLEVSWQRPANLGECAVNYQLTITRDAATANPVTTNLLTYPVLDNSFCIRASISITASSTGLTSSPVVVEYTSKYHLLFKLLYIVAQLSSTLLQPLL